MDALPTKVCKCCQEEKPITEYYRSGKSYMGRCKQCISEDNMLQNWVASMVAKGVSEVELLEDPSVWPDKIRHAVYQFAKYYLKGGKVDYNSSPMLKFIERCIAADPDTFKFEVQVLTGKIDMPTCAELAAKLHFTSRDLLEKSTSLTSVNVVDQDGQINADALVNALQTISDVVHDTVSAIEEASQAVSSVADEFKAASIVKQVEDTRAKEKASKGSAKKQYNPSFYPTPTELQERTNIIRRILKDLTDNSELDTHDIDDLNRYFEKLFTSMRVNQYVDPYLLSSIPYTYAANNLPMSTDMLILYHKYIEPGIIETRKREDYSQLVEKVARMDGVNYYEYDWELIGHEDEIW